MPYIPSLDQIEKAISVIQAGVDYIQKKRAERKARERAERHFLHDFTYVWSPHDDNSEEETIKSRCDSLINILRSHRHFLSGHGRKNAQIGHAHMAGLAFIMGAAFSTPPQSAIVEMAEPAYQAGRTQLESVANEIQMMATHISQIASNVADMKSFAMGLNLRIETAGNEIQAGFATAANIQVQMEAKQMTTAPSYGPPTYQAITPGVDPITSQENYSDLLTSQSSAEALSAAYQRSQTRCIESLSRCASPTNSQYSSFSDDCPTPISPNFPSSPIMSISAPPQHTSFNAYGCNPYGEQTFLSGAVSENQGWGSQPPEYQFNGYVQHLRRFNSI